VLPLHHIRRRKTKAHLHALDYMVYAASIFGPLTALPQLHAIYILKTSGVSTVSYIGYSSLSVLWLYYGFVHRDKPIIMSNLFWLIANGAILVGTFMVKTPV
jgi:uncharacterized protein with PQ loop repeat